MLIVAVFTALSACSSSSDGSSGSGSIKVRSVTVDEPVNGKSAAVRMVIDNGTDTDDELLKVTSPDAGLATLHESKTTADGLATMEGLDAVDVPAGEQTVFRSGGLHVMLEDLTNDLSVGDDVELTLTFAEAGTRTVTAEVVPLGTAMDDMDG